jgi:hypothetical protein
MEDKSPPMPQPPDRGYIYIEVLRGMLSPEQFDEFSQRFEAVFRPLYSQYEQDLSDWFDSMMPWRVASVLSATMILMGVWRDSSQPRFEETGVIGTCETEKIN